MYKVIKGFFDAEDNDHLYKEGDIYPRSGYEPSEDRVKALSTNDNKAEKLLIVFDDTFKSKRNRIL